MGSERWRERWPAALVLAVSAILWVLLFCLVPPGRQDFPLNDDWAYARGEFRLARGDGVDYCGWASMPLWGQFLWAWPFVRALGASHAVLRLSTVVLSWVGLAAFCDLLRQEGVSAPRTAVAGCALALNPLWFLLGGTFMTDVPSLSFSLLALALYGRALGSGRGSLLLAATAVAVVAAVTRQNTVAVPLAAAVLLLRSGTLRRSPVWWLGVALPLGAAVAAHFWLRSRPDALAMPFHFPGPERVLLLAFVLVHTAGLTSLPLLALGAGTVPVKRLAVLGGLMLAAAAAWALAPDGFFLYGPRFPYLGNLITPWGQLGNNTVVVGERPVVLGGSARLALTLAGCLCGAWWLARLGQQANREAPGRPLLLFSLAHLPFVLVTPFLYDRYLLVLLPGILAVASRGTSPRPRWALGGVALAAVGLVSFALMHDWLTWNAARWEVGRRALARGIAATDIEGGFEWDGWFAPGPVVVGEMKPTGTLTLPFNRGYFPYVAGRYALAFSQPPRTEVLDEEPYRLWLAGGPSRFLLVALPP